MTRALRNEQGNVLFAPDPSPARKAESPCSVERGSDKFHHASPRPWQPDKREMEAREVLAASVVFWSSGL